MAAHVGGSGARAQVTPDARRWAVALAVLTSLHALTFLGTGPVDDEFIVYRYARNWLDGNGLVFNVGERVEGYTVPLWTLICALGLAVGAAPAAWTVGIGIVLNAATAFLFGRAWGLDRGQLFGLALALSPALAWHAVGGLGTSLLALLLFGWFASYRRVLRLDASVLPAACWLGAACLLRAEMVLFAAPWILLEWRRCRGGLPLLALLPVALWTGWRWSYYGRLLPVTYDVKKLPGLADVGYGLDYLLVATAGTGFLILLPLALFGAWRARGPWRAAERAAGCGLLLHTLYVVWVGGDYLPLARFLVPTLPLLYWLAARGAISTRGRAATWVVVLVVLGVQWTQVLVRPDLRLWEEQHHERWRAVGRELRRAAEPGTSVALSPIGMIGYYSELPIVDVLGVTNTAVLEADPDLGIGLKGHHRHDGAWVLSQEPDLVVPGNALLESLDAGVERVDLPWERSLWEAPEFAANYEAYWMPIDASDPLIFFLRRGSPRPRGARPL